MAISDDTPMPFGLHKGKPMREVPDEYLFWLSKQGWLSDFSDLEAYITRNMTSIKNGLHNDSEEE